MPQHGDSPRRPRASAERSKNSLPARAEDRGCSRGPESAAQGGGGWCSQPQGPPPLRAHWHPDGHPGQAQLPPGHSSKFRRCPPRDLRRGDRGNAGSVANPKCPFGSAPPLPSLGQSCQLMFPEHSVCASCCSKHFSQGTHWILMTMLFKVTRRSFIF